MQQGEETLASERQTMKPSWTTSAMNTITLFGIPFALMLSLETFLNVSISVCCFDAAFVCIFHSEVHPAD